MNGESMHKCPYLSGFYTTQRTCNKNKRLKIWCIRNKSLSLQIENKQIHY